MQFSSSLLGLALLAAPALAQSPAAPDPLVINSGRIPANYPVPYAPATVTEIKTVLDRVFAHVESTSPVHVVNLENHEPVTDLSRLPPRTGLHVGQFSPLSYEWGVTYAGLLLTAEVTGDERYRAHVADRLGMITTLAAHVRAHPPADVPPPVPGSGPPRFHTMRNVVKPRSLDDSGSLAAAFIKAARAGIHPAELRPVTDHWLQWISKGQFRLSDGTLARNRPLHNTLWLDDLYMSVPALAQMGVLTGETHYFDDATAQVLQFASRMFARENSLFMHGWVQEMNPHPAFHWARANGWAIVAMAELLSVLPEDHPQRAAVLELYRAHARGLAAVQGSAGLWHQLLDRPDSYLETSASAMFTYAIARGINRGWLDPLAYVPVVSLGWNAVALQVNELGQVENTCVGTGMAFDPMFYYHRPVSVYAAHGYGPVLLAGAEMIALRQGVGQNARISDGSVQAQASPSHF
ncbi:MAG: glycoside hydrolase family 88 protein [Cephaloticoccus sp.]|nr:glycoside hydrolase family 88 protein [Akkermansiaceae bacterium]MCF7761285.1 glycoside hydrolase family 88 protein [Cephaloticoccus sp.]